MDYIERRRKEFWESYDLVDKLELGTHTIEVAEILDVGEYLVGLEVAVVKDTNGIIWAIPEDTNYDKLGKRLVSRWDVKKGMKLKVVVKNKEEGIAEVTIL